MTLVETTPWVGVGVGVGVRVKVRVRVRVRVRVSGQAQWSVGRVSGHGLGERGP